MISDIDVLEKAADKLIARNKELEEQLATIEHVTHDKITENIQLRDTIDTLGAENARITDAYKKLIAKLNTEDRPDINITP